MYSVYVKPRKWRNKQVKNEYEKVMKKRINFVQSRIKKEQAKINEFKYF